MLSCMRKDGRKSLTIPITSVTLESNWTSVKTGLSKNKIKWRECVHFLVHVTGNFKTSSSIRNGWIRHSDITVGSVTPLFSRLLSSLWPSFSGSFLSSRAGSPGVVWGNYKTTTTTTINGSWDGQITKKALTLGRSFQNGSPSIKLSQSGNQGLPANPAQGRAK